MSALYLRRIGLDDNKTGRDRLNDGL